MFGQVNNECSSDLLCYRGGRFRKFISNNLLPEENSGKHSSMYRLMNQLPPILKSLSML